MRKHSISASLWIVLSAVACAAGVWLYAERVLIPYQIADAAAHGRPRGNLSDLYPRWLGARELLLHGRDPYSSEITRESQMGFYGRLPDPELPGGRNYQQGFYYPVYVVFYLSPMIHLRFEVARKLFSFLLFALTVAVIPLTLQLLRWPVPEWMRAAFVILTIGSLPVMQGLKLQQMTLLVLPLLLAAMVLLGSDRQILAGILLALATVKPQLVWPSLLWLTIWSSADWRRRYRWSISFLMSMGILWLASECYLPHWVLRFWQALREYRSYTGEMSVMDMFVGTPWSRLSELLAFGLMAVILWRERRAAANSVGFSLAFSVVLAMTTLLSPTYGPYNQAVLVPVLMFLFKERETIWRSGVVNRVLSVIVIVLIGWPWLSSVALAGLSFILPPETVERGWPLPFWTALPIPVAVAALMLVFGWAQSFAASRQAATS